MLRSRHDKQPFPDQGQGRRDNRVRPGRRRRDGGGTRRSRRKAHVVPADLSDPRAAADLAHAAVGAFGRLDIVVNNVGGTHTRTSPSLVGRVAGRGWAAYCTAKAALERDVGAGRCEHPQIVVVAGVPPPALDRRTCTPYGPMSQPSRPRARLSRRSGMPGGPRCPAPAA
ncbi:SDR family NAD(P)-dependent oxidoreductase [Streptomyces caniscabiei]|uniref:SDR family NAD(P)-dependent oxidoreductase n=1 Tax=Streptomyces caniscabiei TaxID=2746961 RepID=UPI002B2787E3|nr:SDR family NAD(P)-dependent oxidoreductase [Streptomyces caniscabiei]